MNEASLYISALAAILFLIMWGFFGAFVYKKRGHKVVNGALLGVFTGLLLLPLFIFALLLLGLNSVYATTNFPHHIW